MYVACAWSEPNVWLAQSHRRKEKGRKPPFGHRIQLNPPPSSGFCPLTSALWVLHSHFCFLLSQFQLFPPLSCLTRSAHHMRRPGIYAMPMVRRHMAGFGSFLGRVPGRTPQTPNANPMMGESQNNQAQTPKTHMYEGSLPGDVSLGKGPSSSPRIPSARHESAQ